MARKTFGRNGETIRIVDGEDRPARQFAEVDAGTTVDDGIVTGNVAENASEPSDTFETVGERIEVVDGDREPAGTDPTTAEPNRTRRRRSDVGATRTRRTAKVETLLTANLEKVLVGLHTMGAALLNEPELKIDDDEAKLLKEAMLEVASAYGTTFILNPKTQALLDTFIACGIVYGPRVKNIYRKHRKEKTTEKPHAGTPPSTVKPNGAYREPATVASAFDAPVIDSKEKVN